MKAIKDLGELKRIAEAATPGPWDGTHHSEVFKEHHIVCDVSCSDREIADTAYIATFNPETVLALIAELERLRNEVIKRTQIIREAAQDD